MERYFKLFIVALLTTTSFALTSCGNDEPNGPDDGGNTIVINGVKYKINYNMGQAEYSVHLLKPGD